MANMRYFSDFNGATVELAGMYGMDNAKFAEAFPGIKGRRSDSFARWVGKVAGSATVYPVTRVVEFKSNPSRHECDSRCMNATGKIMRCECQCGGKNHGRGSLACVAA